jgi:cobaltochelatase CobT
VEGDVGKTRPNQLLIGDTLYDLTEAYRNGARACRAETPFWANPHREGSQRHADWAFGHDNEAAGHHLVNLTVDVIEARPEGVEFIAPEEEDVPAPEPTRPAYRVFTTRLDETVSARDLLDGMADRRPVLRDLMNRFGPDQEGAWTGPERDAASRALAELKAGLSGGDMPGPTLILLDNSGSMRGRLVAGLVGVLDQIGPALEEAGAPFEVLGFTTRTWKGGRSRETWIMEGRPKDPGRLCDLRHVIYKPAEDAWDPDPMSLMFAEGFLKENVDGEALLWAAERARALGGGTILHVTDGAPVDQSTLAANPADYLERHLEEVRQEINADPELQLITLPVTPDLGRLAEVITRAVLSVAERRPATEAEEAPSGP